MARTLLAAIALACATSPALADASDAVTWGGLGFIALVILGGIAVVGIILFVLSVIASGYHH